MHPSELNFAGQRISNYLFKERLGKGKFSAVWLATDLNAKRDVAIKVLAETSEDSPTFKQTLLSFQTDLQSLAALGQQWAVLTYYTSFPKSISVRDDGGIETHTPESSASDPTIFPAFFIVMELADGGCLGKKYTDEVVKMDAGDRIYIHHFIEICMALQAAHEKKIIHRDIKPQNIFWFKKKQGPFDRVKLGDFGIAKLLQEDDQEPSQPRGANSYMSPEAFHGGNKASSSKRDIYALGCTFYELLTAQVAFTLTQREVEKVKDFSELRKLYYEKHANGPRPDAMEKSQPNTVSVRLNELIKEMMAAEPKDRPELKEVIERLQAEQQSPIDIANRIDKYVLPSKPLYLSDYEINPNFRFQQEESVYFIFVTMTEKVERKYKALFALLHAHFDDTFSVCDVFGRYDFVIRVWSRPNERKVYNFCKQLVQYVLDGHDRELHVMHCLGADYLGVKSPRPSGKLTIAQTRILLYKSQESTNSQEKSEATKTLRKHHIFLRFLGKSAQGSRVKCFCLIKNQDSLYSADRLVRKDHIKQELEMANRQAKRQVLSVYFKALQPFEDFENEPSDYLVTYVADKFEDAISVPTGILEKFHGLKIQTATVLATKRYYIESDRMVNP